MENPPRKMNTFRDTLKRDYGQEKHKEKPNKSKNKQKRN